MRFIVTISIIQCIIFYGFSTEATISLFICDPRRRFEIWRYFTPMFIHCGSLHLFGNISEQLVHGYMLETTTHLSWKKVASIYLAGVVCGEITVGAMEPWNYAYGASGGCFALIAVNWMVTVGNPKKVNFSVFRYGFVLLEAILILLVPAPAGSNAAHLGGAIGGILTGSTLLLPVIPKCYKKNFSWLRLALLKLILFSGIAVTVANILWYGESRIVHTNKDTVAHVIKKNSKSIEEVFVEVIVKQVLSILRV